VIWNIIKPSYLLNTAMCTRQSLDFFDFSCLNMHEGVGMKVTARCLWGGFLSVMILLGIGTNSGIIFAQADETCSTSPNSAVSQMLNLVSQDQWLAYLQDLTGERTVMISGQSRMITTRYTPSLFDGSVDAMAFDYIEEQLASMNYPPNTIMGHFGYLEHNYTYNSSHWQNLILTIPGQDPVDPRELILSAHLDDLPVENAPGAEDNGVGAAALLEMARVLRYYQFDATIKLIWFTGEEQGLQGSQAYLLDYGMFSEDLVGVINLDMFGYDSNGDDCFEIHAGTLPESHTLGDCLVNSIAAYSLPLTYDYIKDEIESANSDHLPFWANGFGAIEILENHFNRQTMDDYQQCGEDADANPYYHSMNDTIANSIDIPMAFNLVKASLATTASVAEPQGACFETQPALTLHSSIPNVILDWQNMGGLITYRLYRSYNGCEGPWQKLADALYTTEYYDTPIPTEGLAYQLEAIAPSGMCYSLPSNCVTEFLFERLYLPLLVSNIPACDVGCAIMQILPQ
jgi:hypothetical protein